MEKNIAPEIKELAEQVGEFMRYWGFKKVHGQIWLHIYLSPEGLDAAALMKRLKISKALVSMTLADLIEYRVVLPGAKSKNATQLYLSNPNLMEAILNVLRSRERKMLSRIQASMRGLKKLSLEEKKSIELTKVKQLSEFIEAGEELLDAFLLFKDVDLSVWANFQNEKIN